MSAVDRIMEIEGCSREEAEGLYEFRRSMMHLDVEANIEQHGWAVRGVFGIDGPNGGKTAYVYTIGNDRLGLPELLMTGADPNAFAGLLNDVTEAMRSGVMGPFDHGSEIHPWAHLEGEEDMALRVVRLDPQATIDEDWFNVWFAQHDMWGGAGSPSRSPVWAYQLVWPGRWTADGDTPTGDLHWPTVAEPWRDQPIFGEVWWND